MDLLGTPEPPMNITDKVRNMVFTINSMFTDILFTIIGTCKFKKLRSNHVVVVVVIFT